jgi:4-diphosphocytidyl-2-C-methyl-D-erythritol kinase
MRLAAALGSDVAFFLQGGTALGVGRGEELYPIDDAHRMGVVLLKPSFGVGTADAYRWLDQDRAAAESPAETPVKLREVDVGWPAGPIELENDLQAPVARRHPAIGEMVEACLRQGAIAAAMTGSGSAVFGLFSETVAPRAARSLQRPDWLVVVTRFLPRREASRRLGL